PNGVLVLICLVVGILPGRTIGPFLHTAVSSVLGDLTPNYSLAVWHGISLPLLMSTLALVGGIAVYTIFHNGLRNREWPPGMKHLNSPQIFDTVMIFLSWRLARGGERWLSTAKLQPMLRLLVTVALLAAIWPLLRLGSAAS